MSEELPESKNIKTLFTYDTVYSADSVEWCPHDPHQNVFVCANYQLLDSENKDDSSPKERVGRILLFSINHKMGLKLHHTIDTAAILDQKWCHNKINNESILGAVTAKNSIEIYKLNCTKVKLELLTSYKLEEESTETLILSLDWSTGKYQSQDPEVLCTTSKGDILLFKYSNNELTLQQSYHAHEYEAWICAFYYWDPNIFFSGGDDSAFLKYDKRTGTSPVGKNRTHEAGVTSMHSHITKEFTLATGSYDEHVRMWDIRKMKTPLNYIKMPGPLWRLKWDPFNQNHLLSACMLGGVHVINAKDLNNLEICESFYDHKNIAYGADWCYLKDEELTDFEYEGNRIIGSCSFYDHLLCISKLNIN